MFLWTGYTAYRNLIHGSVCVRSIVKIFSEHAKDEDVLSLLTKVRICKWFRTNMASKSSKKFIFAYSSLIVNLQLNNYRIISKLCCCIIDSVNVVINKQTRTIVYYCMSINVAFLIRWTTMYSSRSNVRSTTPQRAAMSWRCSVQRNETRCRRNSTSFPAADGMVHHCTLHLHFSNNPVDIWIET